MKPSLTGELTNQSDKLTFCELLAPVFGACSPIFVLSSPDMARHKLQLITMSYEVWNNPESSPILEWSADYV